MALLFREMVPKLVLLHLKGKLDPVVGRQVQIERVTQILGRRTKITHALLENLVLEKQLLQKASLYELQRVMFQKP